MASDRWHEKNESATAPTKKVKSNGIDPSSFHKNLLKNEQLTPTERRLENILHSAAHNEVVQKRSEHTTVQKMQRESYHAVTSFKSFPLQDLAMDYLFSMIDDYLGDEKPTSHLEPERPSLPRVFIDGIERNEPSRGDDLQSSPMKNCKRRKLSQNSGDINVMMEKYTASFLEEKHYSPPTQNGKNKEHHHLNFLPELWSMEPRIFALETSSSGKRRYLVGQLGRFLQLYWRESDPRARHFYELIREGVPCRLYFDLEFCKRANPHITPDESEALMKEFIQELCTEFRMIHAIQISRSCIVDLDSSTDSKFSRHLIVHLPNRELFADACSAGVFAKRFVGRLAEDVSRGSLAARHAILAKHLFVNSQASKTEASRSLDSKDTSEQTGIFYNRKTTCFVDLGVYTRNRLFRLMGSTKFGKSPAAQLRIARANEFPFPTGFSNNDFYRIDQVPPDSTSHRNSTHGTDDADRTCNNRRLAPSMSQAHDAFCASLDWETHACALAMTLVVPANASKTNTLVLSESSCVQKTTRASVSRANRKHSSSSRSCNGISPILKLDKFILGSTKRGGAQGKIRTWSMQCLRNEDKPDSYYMSYQMSDNRWCENIGRSHKSNNIIWNVDMTLKTFWQTCHDPECRASNFRGRTLHLPKEVATEISEFLLDKELEELDEDEIIRGSNNPPDTDFGSDEFDRALGDLDLSMIIPKRGDPPDPDFDDDELDEALGDLDMTLYKPS